jgi:hypothetical protein
MEYQALVRFNLSLSLSMFLPIHPLHLVVTAEKMSGAGE